MKYFKLDKENETAIWNFDLKIEEVSKLVNAKIIEIQEKEFNEILDQPVPIFDNDLNDHPLPDVLTVEVVRNYSAAELTVHYTKGAAIKLAKENGIKGYSKYNEEELFQYLKGKL